MRTMPRVIPRTRKLVTNIRGFLSGSFSPASLFRSGEQGAWYDFSDFSTLFQDSAGTIPVTAVEQPIGKILDKSGRGNHAIQATAAARPVLSARKNWLTYTEELTNAAWINTNLGVSMSGGVATLTPTVTSGQHQTTNNAGGVSGSQAISAEVKPNGYTKFALKETSTTGHYATFDLSGAGSVIQTTGAAASIALLPDGYYRVSLAVSTTGAVGRTFIIPAPGFTTGDPNGSTFAADGVSGVLLRHPQAEYAPSATRYQRVTTDTDYDTAGFPHFARFDGVDDSLNTAATVDFTATDAVSVFAGTSRFSSATQAMVAELSASVAANNGSFYMATPETAATANAAFASKGTVLAADTETGINIGTQYVLTGVSDISGDTVRLRVNGVDGSPVLTDQGTGNFGNYTLFTGARNSGSLLLNGQINQLIILGRTPTALEIANTENYISSKSVNT